MNFEEIRKKIAQKLSENLGDIVLKLLSLSTKKIMDKIEEVEKATVHYFRTVFINFAIKTAFIILGIIFIFIGLYKWLVTILNPPLAYTIVGTLSLIFALIVRSPSSDFNRSERK